MKMYLSAESFQPLLVFLKSFSPKKPKKDVETKDEKQEVRSQKLLDGVNDSRDHASSSHKDSQGKITSKDLQSFSAREYKDFMECISYKSEFKEQMARR